MRQNYSTIIYRFRDSALLGLARGNFGLKPSSAVHDVHCSLPLKGPCFQLFPSFSILRSMVLSRWARSAAARPQVMFEFQHIEI